MWHGGEIFENQDFRKKPTFRHMIASFHFLEMKKFSIIEGFSYPNRDLKVVDSSCGV
jgi:hypothetical protein